MKQCKDTIVVSRKLQTRGHINNPIHIAVENILTYTSSKPMGATSYLLGLLRETRWPISLCPFGVSLHAKIFSFLFLIIIFNFDFVKRDSYDNLTFADLDWLCDSRMENILKQNWFRIYHPTPWTDYFNGQRKGTEHRKQKCGPDGQSNQMQFMPVLSGIWTAVHVWFTEAHV